MKKIVMVGSLPNDINGVMNGPQKVSVELYKEILKINPGVVFLNLHGSGKKGYDDFENIVDIGIQGLVKYLLREKPDIVHISQYLGRSIYLIVALRNICGYKVYYTCHGSVRYEKSKSNTLTDRDVRIEDFVYKGADKIFPVSHKLRDRVVDISSVDEAKINVIYNGAKREKTQYQYVDVRTKYKIAENRDIVFSAGTSIFKDIPRMIKAIKTVKNREIVLVVAGNDRGSYIEDIKKENEDLIAAGRLLFVGVQNQNEMLNWYNQAYVYMQLSSYETFGLAVVEAISQGTPVILSDEIGVLGTMEINDKSVHMICGDSLDIEDILNNVDRNCEVEIDISWSKMAKEYCEFYEENN